MTILFIIAQLCSLMYLAQCSLFENAHSYVANQLEAVATNSILIDFELFANQSMEQMHVNDANPIELITQVTVNGDQIFCVINRKTALAECDYIETNISITPKSKITLAAYIDSTNNSKLAGCFVDTYSGNNSTLSCFVGNRQIGKWPNKHLEVLRYRSSGTIETVVTENNTVYMTIGANINTLMTVDDSSKRLVSVVFISEDRLALAFSVENGYVQVYLCTNLSTISNCTADGRIFVAQSGLTMGFVITKSNNYKYLFVGSNAIFTTDSIAHLWNYQLGNIDSYLFDRHQLIALDKYGHLRYVNVAYRESVDDQPIYASGSLQVIGHQLHRIYNADRSFCDRISTDGNQSYICTGEALMIDNETSVISTFVFKFDNQSTSLNNHTLLGIDAEYCQVLAVDAHSGQLLVYCCKLINTKMIFCQSSERKINLTTFDDFIASYDFNSRQITLILYSNIGVYWNIYAFVEGLTTNQGVSLINSVQVIGANINGYNSIMLAVKVNNKQMFYQCSIDNSTAICNKFSNRFNPWTLSSSAPDDKYSLDLSQTSNDQIYLIGLHSGPINYLTIESGNETLAIAIGNVNNYYHTCTNFIIRSSIIAMFCCTDDGNHCGVVQLNVYDTGSSLINGSIPDDQDECADDQGDGGGGECQTSVTSNATRATRPTRPTTTTTTTTRPPPPTTTTVTGTTTEPQLNSSSTTRHNIDNNSTIIYNLTSTSSMILSSESSNSSDVAVDTDASDNSYSILLIVVIVLGVLLVVAVVGSIIIITRCSSVGNVQQPTIAPTPIQLVERDETFKTHL